MTLFNRNKTNKATDDRAKLAEIVLRTIHDGIIVTNHSGVVQFINPAAVNMTDCGSADKAVGLDYGLIIKLESKEGRELSEQENFLMQAMKTGSPLESYQACLITDVPDKRVPVSISLFPVNGASSNRIMILRDITKELAEEGEQMEFISTASHEMRTPVATIDGYLSLALNPRTATIDERARGYLTAAEASSKHLGKLFQDLLDTTKLDDGRIKPSFEPAEMFKLIKTITDDYVIKAQEAKLNFKFGTDKSTLLGASRRLNQTVFSYVDPDFVREIMGNLLDNAFKYTPEGGSVYVNVRGDGDRVLINVTDTGIGISADDLGHIFQKFYRADNSDTRTIGGTGLGLYLVKQRVEAMGGRIWAESAFGEGSTFYVSLPRLSHDEYEKRMIAVRNREIQEQMAANQSAQLAAPAQAAPISPLVQIPSQEQFATPTQSPDAPQATASNQYSTQDQAPQPVATQIPQPSTAPGPQLSASSVPASSATSTSAPALPTAPNTTPTPESTPLTSPNPTLAPPPTTESPPTPPNQPIPQSPTPIVNDNNININGEPK